jgi:hypothetical protein
METAFDIGICFMVDPDSTPNEVRAGRDATSMRGNIVYAFVD